MTTFQVLNLIIFLTTSICRFVQADNDDDETLLSVFFANTGLGRWWREPEYLTLADAQIESLLDSDYDAICLTELNVDKLTTRYADALMQQYPYQYIPPRTSTGSSQCNCTTVQYEAVYECLNDTIASGSNDFSGCWHPPSFSVSCSNCWSAYFDEEIGLDSIQICDGGDYNQTVEIPRVIPSDGRCVYGDGQLNVALFSKYVMSNVEYKAFELQTYMYNGVVSADINKNDIDYHVFCTGFANWRHLEVMQGQAMELEEYMNDIANIQAELSGDTIVILGGDFNTGPKDDCVECVDYPENDGNLTVYNTILDIDQSDMMYSIYLDNFLEDGSYIPRCTSCKNNPRNDDDPDYIEYIGMNVFGFMGDTQDSSKKYIAKRGWVNDYIESLNTSLSDKYAVVIMQQTETPIVSTKDPGDSPDGVARINVNSILAVLGVMFVCVLSC